MRDISQLHPRLQVLCKQVQEECKNAGLIIGIGECFRTVDEQNALYAQGRTTAGSIITNAKGTSYSSQHQWGIAFDFYRNDGTGAYNTDGNFFQKVGAIAKGLGLGWGGDWTSFVDMPHIYLPDWGSTTSKLKSLYGTPDKFKATWGTVTTTSATPSTTAASTTATSTSETTGGFDMSKLATIKKGSKGSEVKALQVLLIGYGYSCGAAGADGSFGTCTYNAVLEYQEAKALTKDGIVGPKTWAALLGA